ncbi:TetR family transcriptional regulator [Leucobacter sp. NPDC015123]|uniref:TetR family transcriptional regulator n=1 Tax=Leucobacter sp. NPDC015123 TaxID=3364129 RepID=UPI0036F49311
MTNRYRGEHAQSGGVMTEGLRERKMRLTREQLEAAAVEIAYAEGVSAVTVDRVCAAAMVSRSTFFNYFPSLEQAIFGSPLEFDPELTTRILTERSGDLVVASSLIVMESVRGQADNPVTKKRLALFSREPELTSRISWSSGTSTERLIAILAAWLDSHPDDARLEGVAHETEARLAVNLSIALGDEAQRHVREVDGELVIDLETFTRIRRQLTTLVTPRA